MIPCPEGLDRYAVLRFLYTHRGRRDGWTSEDMAIRLNMHKRQVERELSASKALLEQSGSAWRLILISGIDEYGLVWPYYFLLHPLCPRPPEHRLPEDYEPELISLEDLQDEPIFTEGM